MRLSISSSRALFWLLSSVPACGILQKATAPAPPPISQVTPAVGQVPDSVLEKLIRGSELIVLAIPLDFMPDNGFLNPSFQLGAKETWYNVRLAVDSVAKGKLKRAKSPDLGLLPAVLVPPPPFGRLASNGFSTRRLTSPGASGQLRLCRSSANGRCSSSGSAGTVSPPGGWSIGVRTSRHIRSSPSRGAASSIRPNGRG
jgi:hypothetical protein